MYTSIISAAALIGITVLMLCLIAFFSTLENNFPDLGVWINYFLFTVFWIYILDLLFSGVFRKIPYLSYLFFPFFKVYDLFSFRKLYQRSLNLFSSNVNKLKFFAGAILFAVIALISTYLAIYRTMHWPNMFDERAYKYQMADGGYESYAMYRDEMSENDFFHGKYSVQNCRAACNQSFVRYDVGQDYFINKLNKPDSLKLYSDVIEISIDDSLYTNQRWFDKWNKDVTYIGVSTMIDIAHLKRGEHILKISTKPELQDPEDSEHLVKYSAEIPFFKDVK
ncbi:MAG: hypothetical protein IPM77_14070 [Crocinitomicaceae bacterium]|nr:hypothetical protein [Crocinitomicaceae bacterium]